MGQLLPSPYNQARGDGVYLSLLRELTLNSLGGQQKCPPSECSRCCLMREMFPMLPPGDKPPLFLGRGSQAPGNATKENLEGHPSSVSSIQLLVARCHNTSAYRSSPWPISLPTSAHEGQPRKTSEQRVRILGRGSRVAWPPPPKRQEYPSAEVQQLLAHPLPLSPVSLATPSAPWRFNSDSTTLHLPGCPEDERRGHRCLACLPSVLLAGTAQGSQASGCAWNRFSRSERTEAELDAGPWPALALRHSCQGALALPHCREESWAPLGGAGRSQGQSLPNAPVTQLSLFSSFDLLKSGSGRDTCPSVSPQRGRCC